MAVKDAALHSAGAAGAADVAGADGEGAAEVDAVDDGVAEADADGLGDAGGALLLPEGLGLGPQAARSSNEAAADVVTNPILMR
ncbi:hypothetical protein OHC50_06095 [Paenarthrobacter ilicis]|uniref:hypothetical protein n=1 Tax=Paenarthrobacter ilicis TaxID=43665 RepID=UPI00300AE777